MKRQGIIISSLGIILISIFLIILRINSPKKFMQDGVVFALKVDGRYENEIPSSGEYFVKVECDNAKGRYMYDETASKWKVSIENISGTVECNLEYDSTKVSKLKDIIENNDNLVEVGNTGVVHEAFTGIDGVTTIDAGYRYEGGNPNNYIWFNNEMWRIIGSVPVTMDVDNNGTTTQEEVNRVKIIRMDPIGGMAWNTSNSNAWTATTPLFKLLNEYYYGARNDGQAYCIGYSTSEKSKCYYSEIGIDTNSRYASMIEEVYWNIGQSRHGVTPNEMYENESGTKSTMTGRIGLMYGSDYGFAQSTAHTTTLNSGISGRGTNDWLYNGLEWTMTRYTDTTMGLSVAGNSTLTNPVTNSNPISIRPVLYLDPDLKVISGDGTIESPYQITM